MSNVSITKFKSTIGERKDIENAIAGDEKLEATVDYIAACDYPEVFEEEEEEATNE